MPSWLLAGLLALVVASVAVGMFDLALIAGKLLGWWD